MRTVPQKILKETNRLSVEALRVQEKYSDPLAQIGEKELDYVALNYMNAEATLFWLPRLLNYLTSLAPKDSYHFEVTLFRLSDAEFSRPLIALARPEENRCVVDFLNWLDGETDFLTGSNLRRRDFDRAVQLWSGKRA